MEPGLEVPTDRGNESGLGGSVPDLEWINPSKYAASPAKAGAQFSSAVRLPGWGPASVGMRMGVNHSPRDRPALFLLHRLDLFGRSALGRPEGSGQFPGLV